MSRKPLRNTPQIESLLQLFAVRVAAEIERQSSEQRFHDLFEFAPDAMIITTGAGIVARVNRQAEKLFDYEHDEMVGQPVEILMLESNRPGHLPLLEQYMIDTVPRAMGTGHPNLQGRKKDGSVFSVEISLSPLDLDEDRLVVAAVRDITERKLQEEELRSQTRQQRVVSELGQIALGEVELLEFMQMAAQRVADTLGVEFSKILELQPDCKSLLLRAGVGWQEWFLGKATVSVGVDSQAGFTLLSKTPVVVEDLRTETRFHGPALLNDHGVISGISVVIGGSKGPYGVLGAHTRAQRTFSANDVHFLQAVANLLAETVRQHETREKLRKSEAMLYLSQKIEAIGRLAGGIAHDFNNIIGVILGYAQLLQERLPADDRLTKPVDQIRKASERAADLTRQLLAFSRKQVLEPRIVNLNPLITDLQPMLQRIIGEDIVLESVLAPDLGRICVDPGQIGQIIMNLAGNARDSMPLGGKITIETSNEELDEAYAYQHPSFVPDQYARLTFSDTGAGMDSETMAHIFEPFFSTKKQGTGLGLATTYGIVKQSGGYIWVYSELGHGTTFKIYLPRVLDAGEMELAKSEQVAETKGTETILLVEDSEQLRELIRDFLVTSGYEVLVAENGTDALRFAQEHPGPIQLLLTDVVMPEMSGREVAGKVTSVRKDIKVLFMSGYTENAISHHGVIDPGTLLIAKPFIREALVEKVKQALQSDPSTHA